MATELYDFARRLRLGGAVLLLALTSIGLAVWGPAVAAGTAAPGVAPVSPGTARIWIYRDYEPYETLARPYVRLNGAVIGISEPGAVFYRDVAPGTSTSNNSSASPSPRDSRPTSRCSRPRVGIPGVAVGTAAVAAVGHEIPSTPGKSSQRLRPPKSPACRSTPAAEPPAERPAPPPPWRIHRTPGRGATRRPVARSRAEAT
jgi:hypothetical protein